MLIHFGHVLGAVVAIGLAWFVFVGDAVMESACASLSVPHFYLNGHCFTFNDSSVNIADAEPTCAEGFPEHAVLTGGRLAVLPNITIINTVLQGLGAGTAWVGVFQEEPSNIVDANWYWKENPIQTSTVRLAAITASRGQSPWARGYSNEPNDYNFNERCAVATSNGLCDMKCSRVWPFACEYPPNLCRYANPCKNNGTCVENEHNNATSCTCTPQWKGENCTEPGFELTCATLSIPHFYQNGHCFTYHATSVSVTEAESKCTEGFPDHPVLTGGRLAVLPNMTILNAVFHAVDASSDVYVWVGAFQEEPTTVVDANWFWKDNPIHMTPLKLEAMNRKGQLPWKGTDPDDWLGEEQCAVFRRGYAMWDTPCSNSNHFACEFLPAPTCDDSLGHPYTEADGYCFVAVVDRSFSWDTALQFCASTYRANLATLETPAKWNAVKQLAADGEGHDEGWYWTLRDGTIVKISATMLQQTKNADWTDMHADEKFGMVKAAASNPGGLYVEDQKNDLELSDLVALCEFETTTHEPKTFGVVGLNGEKQVFESACSSLSIPHFYQNGHCFTLHNVQATVPEAESSCTVGFPEERGLIGGRLAVLPNMTMITAFCQATGCTSLIFLGGYQEEPTDVADANWYWKESPVQTSTAKLAPITAAVGEPPWKSGEPNDNGGVDERCACIFGGALADVHCTQIPYYYACEFIGPICDASITTDAAIHRKPGAHAMVGHRGRRQVGMLIKDATVESLTKCLGLCYLTKNCVTLTYFASTRYCTLHSVSGQHFCAQFEDDPTAEWHETVDVKRRDEL